VNLVRYLIKADPYRRTRLHDQRHNLVGLDGLAYAPAALWWTVLRHLSGYRPALPWIPYQAIRALDRLIREDWKVLEFGSGMSTVWLARRCGFLHSIESDADWFAKVSALLARHNLTSHVRYELRDAGAYSELSDYPDGFFDLCIVDGAQRAQCMTRSVSKVTLGGYVYWDNSDNTDADAQGAEKALLDAVRAHRGDVTHFLGFPPSTFHVCQGLLARLA